MKRIILPFLLLLIAVTMYGQQQVSVDSTFIGRYVNKDLKIFLVVNFIDKNITVKGQDILGELDGYFGCTECQHVWPIVDADVEGKSAHIDVINNYGSEDFRATLTRRADGTIVFRHQEGSTFKFPIPGKWHKIPTKVIFTPE